MYLVRKNQGKNVNYIGDYYQLTCKSLVMSENCENILCKSFFRSTFKSSAWSIRLRRNAIWKRWEDNFGNEQILYFGIRTYLEHNFYVAESLLMVDSMLSKHLITDNNLEIRLLLYPFLRGATDPNSHFETLRLILDCKIETGTASIPPNFTKTLWSFVHILPMCKPPALTKCQQCLFCGIVPLYFFSSSLLEIS